MRLGEIIRQYRKYHNLSQRQFAERCGELTNGYISMLENGKNPSTGKELVPSVRKIQMLAQAMNMSYEDLQAMADDLPGTPLDYFRIKDGVSQGFSQQTIDLISQPLPSNVRPISALHRQRVPLIGGVAAGEPIYDPEELGVYVDSPVDADAAITIHGDSMVPTYQDGDLVYIKCCPDVPEGTVAVVFLDDEATLKHVYKRPTGLTLISDNMATHPPIMVEFEDYTNVRIFGVPVGYTRIYKPDIERKITKGFKRQDR